MSGYCEDCGNTQCLCDDIREAEEPKSDSAACSPLISESKIEEVIASLWIIIFILLWVNNAATWIMWLAGLKVANDIICVIYYAIKEIQEENTKDM